MITIIENGVGLAFQQIIRSENFDIFIHRDRSVLTIYLITRTCKCFHPLGISFRVILIFLFWVCSDVDATMLACIAFSCPNLESMEISTSDTAINRITGYNFFLSFWFLAIYIRSLKWYA